MSGSVDFTRELVLLGTGTSHGVPIIGCHCPVCESTNPRNNRTRTGVAVRTPEGTFLIDTPPELRIQLLRERIDLIHAVIYTHSHADHIFGLDDLRLFGYRLKRAVPLYCEEPVEQQIRSAYSYAFNPVDPELRIIGGPNFANLYVYEQNDGPGFNALVLDGSPIPAFVAPTSGTYRIRITSWFGWSHGDYLLVVRHA